MCRQKAMDAVNLWVKPVTLHITSCLQLCHLCELRLYGENITRFTPPKEKPRLIKSSLVILSHEFAKSTFCLNATYRNKKAMILILGDYWKYLYDYFIPYLTFSTSRCPKVQKKDTQVAEHRLHILLKANSPLSTGSIIYPKPQACLIQRRPSTDGVAMLENSRAATSSQQEDNKTLSDVYSDYLTGALLGLP